MTFFYRRITRFLLANQTFLQKLVVALCLMALAAIIVYSSPELQEHWPTAHDKSLSAVSDTAHHAQVATHYSPTAHTIKIHCSAFFEFSAHINRQLLAGGVYLRGLGKQEKGNAFALHIAPKKPEIHRIAPFIVYVNDYGTFMSADLPPALGYDAQQHLLAFFYAMQWSRENPQFERDAMGEYHVRYVGKTRKKGRYLQNRLIKTNRYASKVAYQPDSCLWDSLKTEESLTINLSEIGRELRIHNRSMFTKAEATSPTPVWLTGSYQQALLHVQGYTTNQRH